MAKESMKAREVKRVKPQTAKYYKRGDCCQVLKTVRSTTRRLGCAFSCPAPGSDPPAQLLQDHGPSHGYIRLFGISRIQFREMA